MYTIKVKAGRQARDALRNHLTSKGIMTKVYFNPVHLTSFYKKRFGFIGGELPVTERVSDQVLSLPMYPTLSAEEMDYITTSIREFAKHRRV